MKGVVITRTGRELNELLPCKVYDVETKSVIEFDSRKSAARHFRVVPYTICKSIMNTGKFKSSITGSVKWYAARNIPPYNFYFAVPNF